jgi:hypothetical protein
MKHLISPAPSRLSTALKLANTRTAAAFTPPRHYDMTQVPTGVMTVLPPSRLKLAHAAPDAACGLTVVHGDGALSIAGDEPRKLACKNQTLDSYPGGGLHPAGRPWTAPEVSISMRCLALVFVGPVLKRCVNSRLPPFTSGAEMLGAVRISVCEAVG